MNWGPETYGHRYCGHGKRGDDWCEECENPEAPFPWCAACAGSGLERVLGRDNSEVVIPCSVCQQSSPGAAGSRSYPWGEPRDD